ncbi:Ig-like domain-containing protein [Knoellia aerolata]|uniref:Fibronectin-binding protein n=1 Tax=Knoellia aerolata DSM 18566 TaxID=1385519 RepID=A0A0A0JXC8_9MICO|nr:Ig-like domain-containing protein [Knoellia aerolata]KGN40727.1 fibronectin-binding protein [Knoellia aerolata DSM 18566]
MKPFRRPARPASLSRSSRRGRSRGRVASTMVVVLAGATIGYAAVTSQGATVHEADVGDGGVWITSDVQAKFGRLNKAAAQLDAGVAADVAPGSGLDVLQDGMAVIAWSRATAQLQPIDVRTAQFREETATAPGVPTRAPGRVAPTLVDLRAGVLAAVDPRTGKVWAQHVDTRKGVENLSGLATGAKPLATVGADAVLAVGEDGAIHVASGQKGTVTTIRPTAEAFAKPVTEQSGAKGSQLQVTAVGSAWAVYDPERDALHSSGRTEGVAAGFASAEGERAYAAVQLPGPGADAVAVAGGNGLRMVRLDGGAPTGGIEIEERVNRSGAVPLPAHPVVLRGCVHGAWSETGRVFYGANCGREQPVPTGTIDNVSETPLRDGVAFRVNRGIVALNDLDNGSAWDVERDKQKIDNWDALIPPPQRDEDNKKKDKNVVDDAVAQQPPTAKPDTLAVRPGRTSKLHVLDNDTDAAGSVLAIDPRDVSAVSDPDVRASVSADGQSIDVTVPAGSNTPFQFTYLVGNGKVKAKARAAVKVTVVADQTNNAPFLREGQATLARTAYPVLAGKRLSVPVIADWRDPESDPVIASVDGDGLSIDGQGRIAYLAPPVAGKGDVDYVVDDGRGGQTKGAVPVEVVALTETRARPPVTQPDVIRGVVGKSLQIEPLGNDISGADPGDPDDSMHLAGDVRAVANLTVDSNRDTGVVTVTPSGPGSFELSYAAQVGGGVTPGRIRVDVIEAADPEAPPVAVGDTATLRDQAPTLVDPLANDYSPRADVLVTQGVSTATSEDSWLRASIYQGRWIRVVALDPAGPAADSTRRGTIRYTVSDGSKTATGELSVTQKPARDLDPVVEDDKAVVREGDTVAAPVLDNDTMADGIPLRLDPLSVKVLGRGAEQTAFASGNVIRFVPAATGLRTEQLVTVEYAVHPEGMPERAQTGRLTVRVTPLPSTAVPNQAPVARSFSSSVTAGDPLTITVPTTGVDPDGDTVGVVGVVGTGGGAVDLRLGRVVSTGPSTIRYESFPTSSGTEVINYEVVDRFGAVSRAFVRVGVVAPGDPQPPVAVDDTVTAAPGKTVTSAVTANDLIARGDAVELQHEELNPSSEKSQWKVDVDESTVTTTVPDEGAPVHDFVYGISNGLFDPSRASLLVRGQKGWLNPPTALDDIAKPRPGETATVTDVLANDTDIDSDPATLKVVEVLSPNASIEGNKVSVAILDHPYSVPYVIEDEDGARAMAVVHVPRGSGGTPFVVEGSVIEMDKDASRTVRLGDYVRSPQSRVLGITSASTISTAPGSRLAVTADADGSLTLTSSGGYVGPASVMFEVTDQQSDDQKDVHTAYVSIPVQIGPKVPLLRCPTSAVSLIAGGLERTLDIPTLCRAWLPVGLTLDDVEFTTSWQREADDVRLEQSGAGRRTVTLSAGGNARSGEGVLRIGAKGSDLTAPVKVTVIGAPAQAQASAGGPDATLPAARLRPISVNGLQEGDSQQVDVRSYLDSPLRDASCTLTAATVTSGEGLTVTRDGCLLTVSAGERPSPTGRVSITVSDGPNRSANGAVAVTMLGRPGAPTAVAAQADRAAGGRARVSWSAPGYDGGAPIRTYTASWTGGSAGSLDCTASPCTIDGLTNGKDYFFTVTATNVVGESDPGGPSTAARPDTKPGPVPGVTMAGRGDGSLTIQWSAPENKGSAVSKYVVRLVPLAAGGSARTVEVAAPANRIPVTGLENEVQYSVAVQAWNEAGPGPFGPAVTMQSAGTPPAVTGLRLAPDGVGANKDLASIAITWDTTRPNGPPLKNYTVHRRVDGGGWAAIRTTAPGTTSTNDQVRYDGRRYDYVVTATNGADLTSPQTNPQSFTSIGQPSTPSVSAATPDNDERVRLTVSLGQPRSGGFTSVTWRSSGGASGTFPCGSCPAGGQVTITTSQLSTSPQTFTVTTDNGTRSSNPSGGSNQVQPYGPTPRPDPNGGSTSGRNVTYNWTLPTNGRPVTRVVVTGAASHDGEPITSIGASGNFAQDLTINIRAYSAGGESPVLQMTRRTDNPPQPQIYNVGPSPEQYNDPAGVGTCRTSTCPKVNYSVRDFPPNTSWNAVCESERAGNSTTRTANIDGSGNGYSMPRYCLFARGGVGQVRMHLWNGSQDVYSPWVPF